MVLANQVDQTELLEILTHIAIEDIIREVTSEVNLISPEENNEDSAAPDQKESIEF